MKHDYTRGDYDPATKTLNLSIISDRRDPKHVDKIWQVDPQLQIINLLKEISILLAKLVAREAPYHTGPKAVSLVGVASIPPPPPPVSLEESEAGEF